LVAVAHQPALHERDPGERREAARVVVQGHGERAARHDLTGAPAGARPAPGERERDGRGGGDEGRGPGVPSHRVPSVAGNAAGVVRSIRARGPAALTETFTVGRLL